MTGLSTVAPPLRRVRQTAQLLLEPAVVYQPDQDAEEASEGGGNDE